MVFTVCRCGNGADVKLFITEAPIKVTTTRKITNAVVIIIKTSKSDFI